MEKQTTYSKQIRFIYCSNEEIESIKECNDVLCRLYCKQPEVVLFSSRAKLEASQFSDPQLSSSQRLYSFIRRLIEVAYLNNDRKETICGNANSEGYESRSCLKRLELPDVHSRQWSVEIEICESDHVSV